MASCCACHIFFHLFFWLAIEFSCADARIFVLWADEVRDEVTAQEACQKRESHLASADELRHAVAECSFFACTRGWLTDSNIGTINCSKERRLKKNSKPEELTVTVEKASATSIHLDYFCVKDGVRPCGEPPTFPHTTLQASNGLAMGDELLYLCDPGHTLPKGQTGFSLLCNICGEWYGQVQPCRADDTEPHIDYEHHFLEDSRLNYADLEFERLGFDDHENLSQEKEIGLVGDVKMKDYSYREYQMLSMGTESPKSLHLPWYPSHLAQKTDKPSQQEHEDLHMGGDNYGEMKVPGNYTENPKVVDYSKNVPNGTPNQEVENHTTESAGSNEESRQDGNPVYSSKDMEKKDEAGGKSKENVEDQLLQMDTMNHVEFNRSKVFGHVPSTELMEVVTWTVKNHNTKVVPTLGNGRTGDVDTPAAAKRPLVWPISSLTVSWQGTGTRPSSTSERLDPYNTSYSYNSTHKSVSELTTLTGFNIGYAERNQTQQEMEVNPQPTVEWCKGHNCHLTDWGNLVALVIVATGTVIAVMAIGIWCFKKAKQKNSLTGMSQSSPSQHIEMQQKV